MNRSIVVGSRKILQVKYTRTEKFVEIFLGQIYVAYGKNIKIKGFFNGRLEIWNSNLKNGYDLLKVGVNPALGAKFVKFKAFVTF